MSLSRPIRRGVVCVGILAWMHFSLDALAATIIAGPDEDRFRAAVSVAQDGDTVMLTNLLRLQRTVAINKSITIAVDPGEACRIGLDAEFNGAMLELATNGIAIEGLRFFGSTQTDALRVRDVSVTLRDCLITNCRQPVASDVSTSLHLERVAVSGNHDGLFSHTLEAKDCTFSGNSGYAGVAAWSAELDACVIEGNRGFGLTLINGRLKNCVFRYNSDFAIWFDPDNGYVNLNSCLFFANAGGGVYLGEGGYATLDNCTFTRHTGRPAVFVTTDAHDIFLRHCTVVDNVSLVSGEPQWLSPAAAFWIGSNARLENCLVADNPAGDDPDASGLAGNWTDGGGNVIGGPAHLGSLRDNGGPTLSLMPLPGSPAIDAGQPSDVVSDTRGLSRFAGSAPDAGAIETGAGPMADTDADGLPDIWERFHGMNAGDPTDASSDRDGDGQNALAEYGSGTDPADGHSVHRFEEFIAGPMSIDEPYPQRGYLTWTRRPGVFYYVEASNDFRNWRRLPDAGSPGGSSISWTLGLIEADSPATFYRLVAKK